MELKLFKKNDSEFKSLLANFKVDNDDCLSDLDTTDMEDRYYAKSFLILAAVIENEMVGRIKLYKREIAYKGKRYELGGIGGVRVKPAYRRKGIAGEMMVKAMEVLEQENCDLVFLSADQSIMGSLYQRFGFAPLKLDYETKGKSGKLYTEPGGMIAPIADEEVTKEILAAEESFYIGESTF